MEWKLFRDEWPTCEFVWVTDFKRVALRYVRDPMTGRNTDIAWAEADIHYPKVPICPFQILNEVHSCAWYDKENTWICEQNNIGELEFQALNIPNTLMKVRYCPFCGFTPDKV